MLVRHPTPEDAPAVTNLINVVRQKVLSLPPQSLEETQARWASSDFNLSTDAWLVEEGGQVIAYFSLIESDPYTQSYSTGFVHPDQRGRGLGTQGLRLIEARARQGIPLAPPEALVTLETALFHEDHYAADFLLNNGFRLFRHFLRMRKDLHQPIPEPHLPPHITIQTLPPTEENFRRIHAAAEEAFQDHYGRMPIPFEHWMSFYTSRPHIFDPQLFFLAMEGDEIAGVCLNFDYFEDPQQGYVDDLSVRRAWRRQGIALALLYHTFREFQKRGRGWVALGVDGGSLTGATQLYEKAGMVVTQQLDLYEKVLREGVDLRERAVE